MTLAVTGQDTQKTLGISLRRVVCFALVAGYIDAVGFLDLGGIYPAAMTGNTIQFGMAIIKQEWPSFLLIGSTILCFFCGGLLSSYLRRVLPHPGFEVAIMALILMAAQMVRIFFAVARPLELPLLAFSTAMQGETISRFGGTSIQTIVVTNNLLKFADGIIGRYVRYDATTRTTFANFILPGSAWFAYLIGATSGTFGGLFLTYAFVPPIVLLMVIVVDLFCTTALRPVYPIVGRQR